MKRSDFPLVLIGIAGVVEGATRLQKYGFLCNMKINDLKKMNFYDDWMASHYGPFSPALATDLVISEKLGLIQKFQVTNSYGYPVERFSLSNPKVADQFMNEHQTEYKKIKEIISFYQQRTLSDLLQDVYYQYPQFTKASEIRAEIGKKIYESDSYLSTQYDYPDP